MADFDKFNLRPEPSRADEPCNGAPDASGPSPDGGAAAPSDGEAAARGRRARRRGGQQPGSGQSGDRAKRRLAIACGIASAVAVMAVGLGGAELASAMRVRAELSETTKPLVTLTRSVAAGETVSSSDLTVTDVPTAFAPADAATEASQVAGRVAVVDLTAGNPVSRGSVSGSETASTLPGAVSEGHVGYMLSFSSSADAASPLLRPGDRVDVMGGADGQEPAVICSGVRIVAVDGSLSSSATSSDYSTVTLDVTEDQASQLFAATSGNSSVHLLALPTPAHQSGEE